MELGICSINPIGICSINPIFDSGSRSINPIFESSNKRAVTAVTSNLRIDYTTTIEDEERIRMVDMNMKTVNSSIAFANI